MVETVVGEAALRDVDDADGVVEFGGEGLDEAGFAGAGRAVEEVSATVRDAAVVVPLAAAEEGLRVGDETLFEAGGEDDGGERTLATGRAERLPGCRPGRVDERFPGLLLFGEGAGFGEEDREDAARGEEGGDGEELPRRAALQVDALGVTLALHAEERAVEVEYVAAGAGQQDEGRGEAA